MRLIILADIDDFHWNHGPGKADVLLSCGDVYDQVILEAAQAYACNHIFAVKGNHDTSQAFPAPILDLHLKVREVAGVSFGGLCGSWKYKPRGRFLYEQSDVQAYLGSMPSVQVLLSHNSPRGIHDREDGVHHGFEALRAYIEKSRPGYVFHGHQHRNAESRLFGSTVIGVYGHRLQEV